MPCGQSVSGNSASQGRSLTGSPSPRAAESLCVRAKRLSIFSAAGLGGMLLTGPGDTPTADSPRSLTRTKPSSSSWPPAV